MKKINYEDKNNGSKYIITLGECIKESIPKFEVIELKKDDKIIFENVSAILSFGYKEPLIALKFKSNKYLNITYADNVLLYLYEISKFNTLYDYIVNYTSYTMPFYRKLKALKK